MSTAGLLQPTLPLTPGVDGWVPVGSYDGDWCCVDPLCPDPCATACAFVDLLPTGPLWDKQKAAVKAAFEDAGCAGPLDLDCPSMSAYALYASQVLQDLVQDALRPAVLGADPYFATPETLDGWLERLGWVDCFRNACRDPYLAQFSPYECTDSTANGCTEASIYYPPVFPQDFEDALKAAILRSVVRLRRGVIRNLDGLNWILEPLGAAITPKTPYPAPVQGNLDGTCGCPENGETHCPQCWSGYVELEICSISATLPAADNDHCDNNPPAPVATAQPYTDCTGAVVTLYPSVLAAECIVRSLLTKACPNIIVRCP